MHARLTLCLCRFLSHLFALFLSLGLSRPLAREFFLFGAPIRQSPSPAMHNAAFQAHGLPFAYGLCESATVDALAALLRAPGAFGGGSVTIPLKVDVMAHLDALTPAARAIGAVNTVVREDQWGGAVRWTGDNTDWLGILRPISKRLASSAGSDKDALVALVVGAGGTAMAAAYAMRQLGVTQLFIYNRTLANAELVAQRFNATALAALTPALFPAVDVVVSTVPSAAGFVLPDYLLATTTEKRPVVALDAAYQPPVTPFLAHAHAHGAACVQGFEMLYEQAVEQFRRWHPATAASVAVDVDVESVMRTACLERIPRDQRL